MAPSRSPPWGLRFGLIETQTACWKALTPCVLPGREENTDSFPGTCLWLYDLPEFRAWHHRVNGARNKLLWVKGRPGSGKSVLLKSLRARVEKQWGPLGSTVLWSVAEGESLNSVFFPGAVRSRLDMPPGGVYRNLLAQLYRQDPRLRNAMMSMHKKQKVPIPPLEDEDLVSFFMDDYIDQQIETPTKRTFLFVDAADGCGTAYLHDLLGSLAQMAANSDFSICVASSPAPDVVVDNAVEIVMHQRNVDDVTRYISLNLVAEWGDRNRTVVRVGHRAAGCFLWAEVVVNVLNAAIAEGASQELIEHTVQEMPDDLDGLYEWLFSTMGREEKAETLALMQWVMLASEPLRLNELRVALRLTKAWSRQEFRPSMALEVAPPASLRELRKPISEGGSFETPPQFHRWLRNRSMGLLEPRPQHQDATVYEPLGLQRIHPVHESVRNFFLKGRGFACLAPEDDGVEPPGGLATADFVDDGHFALLNAILNYINMSDFDALGDAKLPLAQMTYEESKYWRKNARDHRHLVLASYPFLQYAAENFMMHLLSPRAFRYFLPQQELLELFSAHECRLWRRVTALMGCIPTNAELVMAACEAGSAKGLLSSVYGARPRLERVFRKLAGRAADNTSEPNSPRLPATPESTEEEAYARVTRLEKMRSMSRMSRMSRSSRSSTVISTDLPSVFSLVPSSAENTDVPLTPVSAHSDRESMLSPVGEKEASVMAAMDTKLPDLSIYSLVSHVR